MGFLRLITCLCTRFILTWLWSLLDLILPYNLPIYVFPLPQAWGKDPHSTLWSHSKGSISTNAVWSLLNGPSLTVSILNSLPHWPWHTSQKARKETGGRQDIAVGSSTKRRAQTTNGVQDVRASTARQRDEIRAVIEFTYLWIPLGAEHMAHKHVLKIHSITQWGSYPAFKYLPFAYLKREPVSGTSMSSILGNAW